MPFLLGLIKAHFHMSGKSQAIAVFTISRPSQILPRNGQKKKRKRKRLTSVANTPQYARKNLKLDETAAWITRAFNLLRAPSMGLNNTEAMLSPEGLKTFVLPHRNSFPNISTRGSGYEIYCLWSIWPPSE